MDDSSVRVAVRIRPQLPKELIEMSRVCTSVTPGEPQVRLGSDKGFTFDYVFDTPCNQEEVYSKCAMDLVNGTLSGYNATILAYGQTGSGKTYTMGTGFDVDLSPPLVGIIPRAIHHLFDGIDNITQQSKERSEPPPQFKITAQFLELYNDEIIDLFDPALDYGSGKLKTGIRIHEDSNKNIYITGVTSERVNSAEEALKLLRQGALSRTTASTQMNAQSSRSHAIFTLHIKQQRLTRTEDAEDDEKVDQQQDFETLTAKFHFVDLAGSERLKRTGAIGQRAKEGISINCGLLALGNVISALGDVTKKALHVPYRDSKLTRLLQDSLGGNSRTLMIACISPSDSDFLETLNTLKYANRARNIQNKVMINQDKSSRTIALLKKEIQDLQLELLEYKQGKRVMGEDGTEMVNDMFHENTMLRGELNSLKSRLKGLQETIDSQTVKIAELMTEKATASWINGNAGGEDQVSDMIKGYLMEIESLRAKLVESDSLCSQLRKSLSQRTILSPTRSNTHLEPSLDSLIQLAKKDIEKDLEVVARSRARDSTSDPSESESGEDKFAVCTKKMRSEISDSESTEDGEVNQMSAELAELTSEIGIKQRLINQIEKTQREISSMKTLYEEKLNVLQARIVATQSERDAILNSFVENKKPKDEVKKIKADYEWKLSSLQAEVKKLQSAMKGHANILKSQSYYEHQLKTLNNEVSEMKRTKVNLMKKIKEESAKHKQAESKSNREIAQLKRKSRQDANLIKNLEAEKRLKSAVLKRKQEEVSALRRAAHAKEMSRLGVAKTKASSPRAAKHKWVALEKMIVESSLSKKTIVALEKEMERKIEERAHLQAELLRRKQQLKEKQFENSSVLKEEVDSMHSNLEHLQNAICEIQDEILQVEENNKNADSLGLINNVVSTADAVYLASKLFQLGLNLTYDSAQKDAEIVELQAKLEQSEKERKTNTDLLQYVLHGTDTDVSPVFPGSNLSSRTSSPVDSQTTTFEEVPPRRKKLTLHPDEMLFTSTSSALPSPDIMPPPPALTRSLTSFKVSSVPSSPAPLRRVVPLSPRASRKLVLTNHPSMEKLNKSPPGSPPVYRRQTSREENVFSRLTYQPTSNSSHRPPGRIIPYNSKKVTKVPLVCSHTIEGHNRPVLAVHALDDILFTASQDRNVILWDLVGLKEVQVFGNHPNNVVSVKYDPIHHLLFTVSNSLVKIWDTRTSKCIKTITSSGLTASLSSQQITTTSEPPINDIALNCKNSILYTAAGDKVRIWDLRKFSVKGKLMGGHQAAIMCLAMSRLNGADILFTGSKDHYIKVFDIPSEVSGVVYPRTTLEPPHYDGIQCLAVRNNYLFSGSRDGIIKKWSDCELTQSVVAHRDWVMGLTFLPDSALVASGCRDGTVKLWSTETCAQLLDMKAHNSPINAIASNSSHLFTASSDAKLKIWKHNNQEPET